MFIHADNSSSKRKLHNNIIKYPLSSVPTIKGLGETIFQFMKKNGNEIAQIDALTAEEETYSQFLQKCVRTAMHMQSMGIKPGDVMTICSLNHLNTFVPFIAAWFIGAIVASTVPQLSLSDTIHLLKQVRPKIIFASTDAIALIEKTVKQGDLDAKIVVFGQTDRHIQFQDFMKPRKGEEAFIPFTVKNVKDTAIITFSSGTTGSPKGICLHHYGILVPMLVSLHSTQKNKFVIMASSAPYWISATIVLVSSILTCSSRVVIPDFNASNVWNWIKTYKVSMVFFATAQWITLTKYGRPDDADTSSLVSGFVGGSSVSNEQILAIRNMMPNTIIINGYGLSELAGSSFKLDSLDDPMIYKIYCERPHSIGRSPPGTECKVVDIETEEAVGPGQEGELRVRSEFSMNGYYNMDSTGAWDSEGFLKTGDLVYYDEEFCFYYVDRIKEMLKYRSWQIAPAQLEVVIVSHPCVKYAIVLGLPHPEDGDHPVAIVELLKPVREEELIQFVNERVSDSHKLRGGVKFIDQIPISPTGKIQRKYIKNLLLGGHL